MPPSRERSRLEATDACVSTAPRLYRRGLAFEPLGGASWIEQIERKACVRVRGKVVNVSALAHASTLDKGDLAMQDRRDYTRAGQAEGD